MGEFQRSGMNDAKPGLKTQAALSLSLLVPMPTLGVLVAMWWMAGTAAGKLLFLLCKAFLLLPPLLWYIFVLKGRLSLSPMKKGGTLFGIGSGILIAAAIAGAWFLYASGKIDPGETRKILFG